MRWCVEQQHADGVISTRGLKAGAEKFGELIFDVNSAYFFNHGGYEFAKQFYADAYKAARTGRTVRSWWTQRAWTARSCPTH